MEQLKHIFPKLAQLQRQAAAEGVVVKIFPAKGKGKGRGGKDSGKGSLAGSDPARGSGGKAGSRQSDNRPLPLVREHDKSAMMDDGIGTGKLVPITWVRAFCHHHGAVFSHF